MDGFKIFIFLFKCIYGLKNKCFIDARSEYDMSTGYDYIFYNTKDEKGLAGSRRWILKFVRRRSWTSIKLVHQRAGVAGPETLSTSTPASSGPDFGRQGHLAGPARRGPVTLTTAPPIRQAALGEAGPRPTSARTRSARVDWTPARHRPGGTGPVKRGAVDSDARCASEQDAR